MRRTILCAILVFALSPVCLAAQEGVPTHKEPRHKTVLDSVRFRIIDVQIAPGDTTLFHVHDAPAFYVALRVSPTSAQPLGGVWDGVAANADPGWQPGDVDIDTAYVIRPVTHRVTNVGSGQFRLLMVTNSAPVRDSRDSDIGGQLPGSAGIMSTWFSQTRVRLHPNATSEWFVAQSPVILVQPLSGRTEITLDSRSPNILESSGAWALVLAGTRYRLRNTSASPVMLIAILVR
jgi:quercetin dioxygenase-like cupin family protein